ncbi:AAA family ATPase [Fodinicurvata fenggangensis]|uniref:AAA family ATPase n=1 Tax=Fodinicurvata fenggangensis TaxID=1121830 RepID=UPI00047C8D09|nr:AAA family ATPase [Fodinicurvata fenggangensis]
MPFEELLAWSGGRPAWQQDALRRLAQQGKLSEDDEASLRQHIEFSEGLITDEPPATVPLASDHLSEAASNAPKTVLASLGPVRNVDRLEPNQPPIRFAVNGITLIYGPNASGKSGYCRITKQLCRSLSDSVSPTQLRGNVFDEEPAPPAEVAVAYRVGENQDSKTELTWASNEDPPAELARISVFDTASARLYVDKERTIEFLPYELDLLNKLGFVVRNLDAGFKQREDDLKRAVQAPLPTGYTQGTTAQQLIAKLVPDSSLAELPTTEQLRTCAEWSEEFQAELDRLTAESRNDPATMARQRREAQQALQTLLREISDITDKVGDTAIQDLSRKQRDAAEKNRAAEASARDLFSDEPIPDVGSDIWRQMLKYAREFAAETFPDREPPQIAAAERCVLCQQELDADAASRLKSFDSYLDQRAAEDAAAARGAFENAVSGLQSFQNRPKTDVTALLAGYSALSEQRKGHAGAITAFFEQAGARLNAIKAILTEEAFDQWATLDGLPEAPTQIIKDEITALNGEIEEFERLARGDEAIQERARRLNDLNDRKKLSEEIGLVFDRRSKLEELCRVTACRAQCRLNAITGQITRRRREILTPSLREALEDELRALQLTHLPLDLSDRGDLGASVVEVALTAQQRIRANSEILSEGEQRGLALACFLAELKEIGRDHGIIVDDPVSSLDYSRMEAVARRLAVEAAGGRQVVIFTHNILFHHIVSTEARRIGVACHEEWMTSLGNDRFGIIDNDRKPWHIKPVTERLGEIDRARQSLDAAGYDQTEETFRVAVTDLYTKMRTTWERTVEEVLFNKVVQRFRPEILTQSLRGACFDAEKDYPVIFEGMKRTSHFSGHDLAEDLPRELPSVADIERDITELRDFIQYARERKKRLEQVLRDYEAGVEPILL